MSLPVYFNKTLSISVEAYWNSLLCELNMMTEISQSHKTLSSYAFFIRPNFRFVKVTCRFRSSEIRVIVIFLRPIAGALFKSFSKHFYHPLFALINVGSKKLEHKLLIYLQLNSIYVAFLRLTLFCPFQSWSMYACTVTSSSSA